MRDEMEEPVEEAVTNLFEDRVEDDRDVSPQDVLDCLQGHVERGEVVDIVVVCETKDTCVHLWASDMRKTEIVGLLEYAKLGFAHAEQHFSEEEEGGEE